jgi:MFS family permease
MMRAPVPLHVRLSEVLRTTAGGLPPTYWYLWTGTLVNRLGSFVVPMLALYLTRERGLSVEQAGLLVSLYGGGAVLAGPVGGALADRVGRRAVMVAGLWLGSVGMLFLGFSRGPGQIALAALLLGLLGELYRPAVSAAVSDVVPPESRTRAFNLLYWAMNVGFSIALPLGGWVASTGFVSLFIADACTTFLYGMIIWMKVPETRPPHPPGRARRALLTPWRDWVFLAFGFPVFLTALLFYQGHVILSLDLTSRGMSMAVFGAVLAVNSILVVLVQPFTGRLLERMRRATALALAATLTGVGFGLHALSADAWMAGMAVAVWTLGEMLLAPVAAAVVADLSPPEQRGSYQGAYSMLWALASCVGPALGGWVFGRHGSSTLWGGCLLVGLIAAGWHLSIADARRIRLEGV